MRRPAARRAHRAARAMGVLTVAALLTTAACTTTPEVTPASTTGTATSTPTATTTGPPEPLVVETVFDHSTLDPTRQYDRSGALVSKALYETLTTYDGADQTKPQAGLAEYTLSPEGNWLTLRLRSGRVFSDGSAVTSDDVVFTLERVKGLGGAAATMLGNVTMRRIDERTLILTSPDANFALPAILANPAFGILNSRAVKANGGTIGPGDSAEPWLSTNSAGSGPYVLSGADDDEVRLTVSPTWAGAQPTFPEVVLRDTDPDRQVADITSGAADVVLDLSPAQADRIAEAATGAAGSGQAAVSVMAALSSTTAFLLLHRDPAVNAWTANPDFAEAVRLGVDRAAVATAVSDAIPSAGIIPVGIVGSLLAPDGTPSGAPTTPAPAGTTPATTDPAPAPTPAAPAAPATEPGPGESTPTPGATTSATLPPVVPARDLPGARAALARSGYAGQRVPLTFARDLPIQGVPTASVAALIAAQLAEVGITVTPTPLPAATALERYRAGRDAFSLWSWNPDYTDPENYLAFAPGGLVGLRAGWPLGVDTEVDTLTEAARASIGADRPVAYAVWQQALDARGPFVPLFQPSSHLAHGKRVSELPTNPVWTLDLARVR
jgi:peptide/nickel transport system substrate-binding protein